MTDTPIPSAPTATGRRVAGDIAVQVVGKLANGAAGIVVLFLIVRLLGPEDFGRWSALLAIMSLAQPLTEVGITQVAVGKAAAEPENEASWLGALFLARMVLAAVTALLCVGVVLLVGDDADTRVAGVIMTGTVLLAGLQALAAVFQVRLRNDRTVVVLTVNSVVWTTAVIAVAAAGGGLIALAACLVGAQVVSTAVQTVLSLRLSGISLERWRERGRELVRIGLPLSITTVLIAAYVKIDQILVFQIAGDEAAGFYGAAYRILEQSLVIPGAVATTLYPLLVRAHRSDPVRMRFLLQRAVEVLVAVGLGMVAFAIPCGGDALALLFGPEFAAAGATLAILMGVFVFAAMGYLNGCVVLIYGLQKRGLVYAAIGLVVNVALNLAFIGPYGYVAAAWATLATELVVVGLVSRITIGAMGWHPERSTLVRILVAATLTGLLLAAGTAMGVPIGVNLVLTPLLYLGLLAGFGGERVAEIRGFVRARGGAAA